MNVILEKYSRIERCDGGRKGLFLVEQIIERIWRLLKRSGRINEEREELHVERPS